MPVLDTPRILTELAAVDAMGRRTSIHRRVDTNTGHDDDALRNLISDLDRNLGDWSLQAAMLAGSKLEISMRELV